MCTKVSADEMKLNFCRIPYVCVKLWAWRLPPGAARWDREHVHSQKPTKHSFPLQGLILYCSFSFKPFPAFTFPTWLAEIVTSWGHTHIHTRTNTRTHAQTLIHIRAFSHLVQELFLFCEGKQIIKCFLNSHICLFSNIDLHWQTLTSDLCVSAWLFGRIYGTLVQTIKKGYCMWGGFKLGNVQLVCWIHLN